MRLAENIFRRIAAAALIFSLTSASLPSRPLPLGIVLYAERARVGTGAALPGTSLYDGDLCDTDVSGALQIRSGTAMLQLAEKSQIRLRQPVDPAPGMKIELAKGILTLSTATPAAIEVLANEASLRPASGAATLAHIRVVNPKELLVAATRGSLKISYHGEDGAIPEGKTYRIILDPSDRELAASSPAADQGRNPPTRPPRKFLFIVIAVAVGVTVFATHEALESPDRP